MDAASTQSRQVRRARFAPGWRAVQLERRTLPPGAKLFRPLRLRDVDQPHHPSRSRSVSRRRSLHHSAQLEQKPDRHPHDLHRRRPDSRRLSGEAIKVVVTRRIVKVLLILIVAWFVVAWLAARALIVNADLPQADAIVVMSGSSTYIERTHTA